MNAPFAPPASGDAYLDLLRAKMRVAPSTGIDVPLEDINPALAPHCRAIVRWALKGGRRAIFASFGLHKTSIQIELMRLILARVGGPVLIVLPLGVKHEFFGEAEDRFAGEFAVTLKFIRRDSEIAHGRLAPSALACAGAPDDGRAAVAASDETSGEKDNTIYLTNYESVRDGKIDLQRFTAASLDEAAVLRGYGTKTFQTFLPLFAGVRFKFVATATPSNLEKHVCPLQFDIVDRLIDRYSNRGDTIYDPFGGLMTVPYRAILRGRRGKASELSATYFRDGLNYCRKAEAKIAVPDMFGMLGLEAEADAA